MPAEIVLSAESMAKLEGELEYLKSEKRQEVEDRIKTAIGFGDLSENAEYVDAKEEQAFLEGKIMELENTLRNAKVMHEKDIKTDIVSIGSNVKVRDMIEKEEMVLLICSSVEANPLENRISNESPVGRALIGRKKGDTVDVTTPGGSMKLKILSIDK